MNRSFEGPPQEAESLPERSAGALFLRIRNVFSELGVLGRTLSLEHEGICYRICCDDHAFMVYRVNNNSGPRHHVPGWPVCLVNSHMVFEESCAPGLGRDHYACGLDIEKWLQMVDHHCRTELRDDVVL